MKGLGAGRGKIWELERERFGDRKARFWSCKVQGMFWELEGKVWEPQGMV